MKKQTAIQCLLVLVLLSIPWIYLAIVWKDLPQTIPTHFGPSGLPDKYGNKTEIIFGPVIFTVLSLFIYLLLTNIYKIDPKRYGPSQSALFKKLGLTTVVFMTLVCILVIYWTVKQQTTGLNLLLAAMGILFAFIGNLMHSIKPNYFAGFRLPWTLESADNWRATHLLVSKIWFAGGLLIALLALFIKPLVMFFVMMGIMLIMVVIPIVYSYRFFLKEKQQKSINTN